MSEKPQGISVIIPNYNGRHLLAVILPCVYAALEKTGWLSEVIVVDDASTDDSVDFFRSEKGISLITNEANLGFSPTMNKGIFMAKYSLTLLLNSDVKLEPDYFQYLLPYFSDPNCFGVMGRIIGWEEETIQDAAKYPAFHGVKIKTSGNYYTTTITPGHGLKSIYLSGANALVNTAKLHHLKGFDELFAPFYIEDVDLSLRAWRMGWICYYEHFAICRHKVSDTIKSSSKKSNINTIYYRNKMFLHAKHLSASALKKFYLQLVPETLIRLVTARTWYIKSLQLFFAKQKDIEASRRAFEKIAQENGTLLSLDEVNKNFLSGMPEKDIIKF